MTLPKTMRAARLHAYREPLRIEEIPVPRPTEGQVVVRVLGAGFCHSDLHIMSGEIEQLPKLPHTLGHENAGVVAAAGPGVRAVKEGDPVAVYGGWGDGFCDYCVAKAKTMGIDIEKVKTAYKALEVYVHDGRAGKRPRDGYYVEFWRILLRYPELLTWETFWADSAREMQRQFTAKAKSVKPGISTAQSPKPCFWKCASLRANQESLSALVRTEEKYRITRGSAFIAANGARSESLHLRRIKRLVSIVCVRRRIHGS